MLDTDKGVDVIEYLLSHGGSINLPYKKNLPDWFSTQGVRLSKDDGQYTIWGSGLSGLQKKYSTLDEALEEFTTVHANNTGAIQEYIRMKYPHVMSTYGDMDEVELARLVKNEKARRKRLERKNG